MIRLIGSVFIYKERAYQTFGYSNYRPLGNLDNILKIYDQHQVDEIFISVRNSKGKNSISRYALDQIQKSNIATPIIYSGGIKSIDDVRSCISSGIERVGLNSLLYNHFGLSEIIRYIGIQGVIAVIPFKKILGEYYSFNCETREYKKKLDDLIESLPKKMEILLIDTVNDGLNNGFDWKKIKNIKTHNLLLQGGIMNELNNNKKNFNQKNISGLCAENILLWRELVASRIKNNSNLFRNIFEKEY